VSTASEVDQFLKDHFRSVWSLELLLHLERHAERGFSADELVEALRASRAIVDQALAALIVGGLIVVEGDGKARYAPANARLRQLVALASEAYATRPDAVRRTIVSGAASGASAFADAFKLRKD
jgi:DNA-binding transcriptional ArsR family regulator